MLKLDVIVAQMPRPEFIQVSPNSRIAFSDSQSQLTAFTTNWQLVLAEISEALITADTKSVIKLLFSHLDYEQLNHNAIEDIRSLVRQPVDDKTLRATQDRINSLKELMSEYLAQSQTSRPLLNCLIKESSLIVEQLKSLEVVGVGAFMIASGFRLALLQAKASSDPTEWSSVKNRAIEDSQYAAKVTPKLFQLTVGRIDKACQCTKWEPESEWARGISEYECRYSDGKDIHLFRAISPGAQIECNKHRLQMFQTVVNKVNQTAAQPVRTALKQWQNMAASI